MTTTRITTTRTAIKNPMTLSFPHLFTPCLSAIRTQGLLVKNLRHFTDLTLRLTGCFPGFALDRPFGMSGDCAGHCFDPALHIVKRTTSRYATT
jgi:hypothetical protein